MNWTGTATGAGGMGPVDPTATGGNTATGQEGLTQDTFVLTLDGLAAAYAGKSVAVAISWAVPVDDDDFYIFKRNAGGTNGAAVGSSANGAPGTSEVGDHQPGVHRRGRVQRHHGVLHDGRRTSQRGPVQGHDHHHHQPHGACGDLQQERDHVLA